MKVKTVLISALYFFFSNICHTLVVVVFVILLKDKYYVPFRSNSFSNQLRFMT